MDWVSVLVGRGLALLLLLLLYDPFLKVRSRDPAMGLLAQAGGQTVVEYFTSKYHLMEVNNSPFKYHLMEVNTSPSSTTLWRWVQ